MFSPQYRALAAALLLFTAAILISSYHIVREYELITGKFVPNLWVAAQAEIEYFRFINQLERHTFDDAEESQELATRLFIFGSRLPLLLQGSESDHVRAIEGAPETVERLSDTLEQLEPAIVALRRGDAAAYRTIYAALKPFEIPLHQIVANTMLKDEEIAASQREEIRKVYWEVLWCIAGITVSASILVVLLFRAFRSASRSLELAHAAEAAETAARAQLKAVIDAVPARIGARDRAGRPVFRNRHEAGPAAGRPDGAAEEGAGLDELDRRVLDTGEPVPLFEETRPGGAEEGRTWLTTKVPLRDPAGAVASVVTVSLEISELKEAQRRNALLATALEHAGDAIEITDAEARFRYVNPAFERISGYASGEALGRTPFSLLMPEGEEARYRSVQAAAAGGRVWHGVLTARRKDGGLYQQEATLSPVRDASGAISHFVAVKRDITERLRAQERIWHLAHHDELTGLPNRALLHDRLRQALAEVGRHGEPAALLLLDLDRFKDVNDTLGHDAGDALLREVARRLRAGVREGDTVARLGGDEFALVLPRVADAAAAAAVAAELVRAVAEPVARAGGGIHTGASVGVTLSPDDGREPGQLLKNADIALYRAKAAGRGTHCLFAPEMRSRVERRRALEGELRLALARGELEPFFQPKVRLADERVVGFEALVRWRHPTRGLVPPDEFLPVAEEAGLGAAVSDLVLRRAVAQARAWQEAGLELGCLAVNLAPAQFRGGGLARTVRSVLDEAGFAPGCLMVEVTEGVFLGHDAGRVAEELEALHAMGVTVALDDFGTGYASLAHLRRFPVGVLKVDKGFVRDVLADPGDAAIVRAVVGLGQSLGMKVVAEGVESEAQLAWLRLQGCDYAQGYLFAPALPAEAAAAYLGDRRAAPRRLAVVT
jgi:diguanylate cyclase (GGDEF)-like protein/PAS domain S-box-containing protein